MTLRKSRMPHSYLGEEQARPLLAFMNRVGNEKAAPVANLMLRFKDLELVLTNKRVESGSASFGSESAKTGFGIPRSRLVKELQARLKKLHRWPVLDVIHLADRKFEFRWASDNDTVEMELVVVELAMMGVLWRVRPCKLAGCRKLFFARYSHQSFCCTAHQQNFYRQTDEWKEHRRKWSKQYRKLKARGVGYVTKMKGKP